MQDLNSNAVPGSIPSSNSKYLETVGISNGTSSALIERFRDKTIKVVVKPGEKKSIVILTSDLEGDGEPLVIGWPYY
jgi:4-hydroxy-3-methylbut-2-enyl diphosphate reductase IspH